MRTITVTFSEPIHHVCLMYGLKQTFERLPFMNRKVLEIGGKTVVMDNIVAPPPMMKNPDKARPGRGRSRNIVKVSYWKDRLTVDYMEDLCCEEDINAFTESLIKDYLHLRHPYLAIDLIDGHCWETSSRHIIAEIQN